MRDNVANGSQVIAVDVGGTKLAGALVDGSGRLTSRLVRPTPPPGPDGTDRVWPELAALIGDLCARTTGSVLGIGVGSAGPLDLMAGTASPVNIPSWRRFPLVERLAAHTGLPVRLAGDGICAAIGEHWLGAARGRDDVVVLVVSTGVGAGVIQRGRLYPGRTGNAGHLGHMVVDLDGGPCACGGRGCVESIASGPSMVSWALAQGWRSPSTVDSAALAQAARDGDAVALAAFGRAARALAAGIYSIAAANDLDHAVIGGGVSRSADVLFPPLRAAYAEYGRLDFVRDLTVGVAELGGDAGLYGAAGLLLDPKRYAA